ncbi:hypothetical protein FOVSG1_015202 [Fusarium oxysporum f. sp. vasinfectum]
MHDYKDTIFKLVGRFNIQGGVIKQAFATNLLRGNGLQPFDDKKHQVEQIGILVISETEYNKPSHFVQSVRHSGGLVVKKSWIEDLHIKNQWFDPCGKYIWKKVVFVDDKEYLDKECQDGYGDTDDEYEDSDGNDEESEDEESEDDESEDEEPEDYGPECYEYEDDEKSEDEAWWSDEYEADEYEADEDKDSKDKAGNTRRYNDSRRLRSQALVHLAAPLA